MILDITKDVKWIGIQDFDLRVFDIVMETKYGTTYNSYFINADKKVIVETAKEKFKGEFLEKVKSVVDPSKIDYIIHNHTEPDHSGSLKHLLAIAPNATVVGSGQAIKYLTDIVGHAFKFLIVKDGDTLDLGNKKLRFIGAPNLHWPDSIYTYLEEDKLLFTCDSFGAHYCEEKMFDDEVGNYDDAFKYYFDVILKPFSRFMLKAIEKIRPLEINAICTGHGPILRSNWKKYVDLSEKYSKEFVAANQIENHKALIMYVSAYGFTKEMAYALEKGIKEAGDIQTEVVDIETIDLGELDSKIVGADALLIGCPTLNQNILLPIYKLFAIINPLRDKTKFAASFGSYGWSGEGVKIMDGMLKNLKLTVPKEGLAVKFRPNEEVTNQIIAYGKEFGYEIISPNME